MKKKIAILALAFSSLNVFAWEANIKTGFDFFRNHQQIVTKGEKDDLGFTLGAEVIPYNKGIFEVGAGFEYNFGITTVDYSNKFFIPAYLVTHTNLYRNSNNSGSIYLLNRLGGVAYKKNDDAFKGGLYYGVGLGADFKAFTAEILYDGAWIPQNKGNNEQMQNKIGVRLGFRIGDYKTKAPVVKQEIVKPMVKEEPKIVEEKPMVKEAIVEMPKVIEEKPEIKVVEEVKPTETPVKVKTIEEVVPVVVVEEVKPVIEVEEIPEFIHGSCATETKICTIYGFKVDGRVPNAEEKNALNEIVDVVNNFAKAGKVEIIGNTDSTGSVKYNQKLSVQRAETVAKLLREYGLKKSIEIVNIKGDGELNPIDTNKTKLGRYYNRRVELIFLDLVK